MTIIVLVEADSYINMLPLTYTRPFFEVKLGVLTFRELWMRATGLDRNVCFTRNYLEEVLKERYKLDVNEPSKVDDDALFVDCSLIPEDHVVKLVKKVISRNSRKTAISLNGKLVAVYLNQSGSREIAEELCNSKDLVTALKGKNYDKVSLDHGKQVRYPWDIVMYVNENLSEQLRLIAGSFNLGPIEDHVQVKGKEIYVEEGVEIEPNVYIVCKDGPVCIRKGASIQANARIEGPCYIGEETIILGSAQIRKGSVIGPNCRVGGELESSILHGYVNKYHFSFVGHSYIGEWVNIGAGFSNSDLKDTYGTVRVKIKEERIDTGLTKYGCVIADHVKTSIGTYVYTGKSIGVASHIHGYILNDVPSFTIWAKSLGIRPVELELDSAIRTQSRVMARRNVKQLDADIKLMKHVFNITSRERERAGVTKGKFPVN